MIRKGDKPREGDKGGIKKKSYTLLPGSGLKARGVESKNNPTLSFFQDAPLVGQARAASSDR